MMTNKEMQAQKYIDALTADLDKKIKENEHLKAELAAERKYNEILSKILMKP